MIVAMCLCILKGTLEVLWSQHSPTIWHNLPTAEVSPLTTIDRYHVHWVQQRLRHHQQPSSPNSHPKIRSLISHIFLASPFLILCYFSLPDTLQLVSSPLLVSPQVPRLTCLLWCMMPKVGNTQVLAGGTMSLSAKLTHCTTCAAASGVRPRSSSLLTAEAEHKGQNLGVVPTTIQSLKSPPLVHSSSSSSPFSPSLPELPCHI